MKRLIIVYNPRSSKFARIEKEVLEKARMLKGWALGKYEVKDTNVDDNAAKFAKILQDGDTVLSAGGDGTATIALNGVMLSKKDVRLAVLGYGNFNDLSYTLGLKNFEDVLTGATKKMWPLEAVVDGKHWRYAASYFTLGLFAESCEVFDQEKMRKNLRKGNKKPMYSWWMLAKWYFENRKKRVFLPKFTLNGVEMSKKTTDVVAVNGKRMAGVMRGGNWYLDAKKFDSATAKLTSFWNLCMLMARSILVRVPGEDVRESVIEFAEPAEVEIQAEGEYARLKAKKVEIRKAVRCVKVVTA